MLTLGINRIHFRNYISIVLYEPDKSYAILVCLRKYIRDQYFRTVARLLKLSLMQENKNVLNNGIYSIQIWAKENMIVLMIWNYASSTFWFLYIYMYSYMTLEVLHINIHIKFIFLTWLMQNLWFRRKGRYQLN